MTPIQLEIIRAVLITMFSASWFNIGHLDGAIKASNTFVDRGLYNELLALHCVKYADMSPTLRRWLFETCIGLFSGNGFPVQTLDHSKPFPPQPGIVIDIREGEWVRKFIG